MNSNAPHDEIRRTAAGLMAVLDVELAGAQLVRMYGEEAVAAALTPVAEAVRNGAPTPTFDAPLVPQLAMASTNARTVRRRAAADLIPQGSAGLIAHAAPWTPSPRPARGSVHQDWL